MPIITSDDVGCLDAAKQGLADLLLRVQDMPHPKLHSLVSIVDAWKTSRRKTHEKVISLSAEVCITVFLTFLCVGCGGYRKGFLNSVW